MAVPGSGEQHHAHLVKLEVAQDRLPACPMVNAETPLDTNWLRSMDGLLCLVEGLTSYMVRWKRTMAFSCCVLPARFLGIAICTSTR
jgi:hypothetical protein